MNDRVKVVVHKDLSPLPPQVDRVIEAILFSVVSEYNTPKLQQYITEVISSTLKYFIDDEDITVTCNGNNSADAIRKGKLNLAIKIRDVEIPYTLRYKNV